jgi:membrane associated rhomboid family serine protease
MIYFFYYIPIGIDAQLRRVPVTTYLYAGFCIFLFAAERFGGSVLPFEFERLAYFPDIGTIVTAITATFLHLGYFHIIGNLVYLLLFGRYVEDRFGSVLFSAVFLGCGALGNIFQGWFNTAVLNEPYVGIIGASGAVSGMLGAFTVRFLTNNIRVAYWVFMPLQAYTRAGNAEIPAIFALASWFVLQLVQGLLQASGVGSDVAYVAHISGFVFGVLAAVLSGQFREGRIEALVRRAAAYVRKGEAYAAQGDFLSYLAHRPDDVEARSGLARAMAMTGDRAGAREHYRKACERLMDDKRRGEAQTLYQEAVRGIEDFALGAEEQLSMAFSLERDLKPTLAVHAYEMFVAKYPSHPETPLALLRAAGIHANLFSDPAAADALYGRFLVHFPGDAWADFAKEQRRRLAYLTG